MKIFSKVVAIILAIGAVPYAIPAKADIALVNHLGTFNNKSECVQSARSALSKTGLAHHTTRKESGVFVVIWITHIQTTSYGITLHCMSAPVGSTTADISVQSAQSSPTSDSVAKKEYIILMKAFDTEARKFGDFHPTPAIQIQNLTNFFHISSMDFFNE